MRLQVRSYSVDTHSREATLHRIHRIKVDYTIKGAREQVVPVEPPMIVARGTYLALLNPHGATRTASDLRGKLHAYYVSSHPGSDIGTTIKVWRELPTCCTNWGGSCLIPLRRLYCLWAGEA